MKVPLLFLLTSSLHQQNMSSELGAERTRHNNTAHLQHTHDQTTHWSIAPNPTPSVPVKRLDAPFQIPRTALSNDQVRKKIYSEHDVFPSPVGEVQTTSTEISDIHGRKLFKGGKVDNERQNRQHDYVLERSELSKVPKEERVFVNAMRKAAHRVFQRNTKPHQVFRSFAPNHTNMIDCEGFQRALSYLGVHLHREELAILFDGYLYGDENETRLLNYDRFLAALRQDGLDDKGTTLNMPEFATVPKRKGFANMHNFSQHKATTNYDPENRPRSPLSPQPKNSEGTIHNFDRRHWSEKDQIFFLLRSKIFDYLRTRDAAELYHAFVMNDKRRVGNVNEQQFILALCALGVTLSPEDGHRLFKELPQSNDGTAMDYNEFVRDLRIDSMHIFVDGQVRSTNYSEDQNKQHIIQERVLSALKDRQRFLIPMFKQTDPRNSGKVNFDNFYKAVKRAGIILSDPDMKRAFNRFDGSGSGFVDYLQLEKYLQYGNLNEKTAKSLNSGRSGGFRIPDPADNSAKKKKLIALMQQKIIDQVANNAPKIMKLLKARFSIDNSDVIDYHVFSHSLRQSGVVLSETDSKNLFEIVDSEKAGRFNYMKLFDFLQENMTERQKPGDPPIYIDRNSEQYQNLLSASGHMQPERMGDPNFGMGLMPRETDNVSRTGNLAIEQLLMKIQKRSDMGTNLLERSFIGLTSAFGMLNQEHFLTAMGRLGVHVHRKNVILLFKKLAPGKKVMDTNDFFRFVRRNYNKWNMKGGRSNNVFGTAMSKDWGNTF